MFIRKVLAVLVDCFLPSTTNPRLVGWSHAPKIDYAIEKLTTIQQMNNLSNIRTQNKFEATQEMSESKSILVQTI